MTEYSSNNNNNHPDYFDSLAQLKDSKRLDGQKICVENFTSSRTPQEKKLERRITELEKDLTESENKVRQNKLFLYMVIHDLKHPLDSIQS